MKGGMMMVLWWCVCAEYIKNLLAIGVAADADILRM
jgi:hypothetical protein